MKALTRGFDTVMFCLSKGLGAPVGSMLVGSAALMARGACLPESIRRRHEAGGCAGRGGTHCP
ncbi:MAG: beta-eliminating lyase-related protein [Terracidiphilus sp.]